MGMILISKKDLIVGNPTPWALYDERHQLLLEQGSLVRDNSHCESLLARGASRELMLETSAGEGDESDAIGSARQIAPDQGNTRFSFDDMKLKVESRLLIEPPIALGRDRLPIKVLGYLKGVSLMVTAPIGADGLRLQLMEGEKVVVRSFCGQNAFAFSCNIQRVIKIPYEYLHLSFPDDIQGIVVRKAPRIKTRIIATVSDDSDGAGAPLSALISNISADGLALDSKHPLGNKGDTLRMAFRVKLHRIDASLTLKGMIRAVLNEGDDRQSAPDIIRHGIEFQNLQPNDQVILQSMIYQQIIENPQQLM